MVLCVGSLSGSFCFWSFFSPCCICPQSFLFFMMSFSVASSHLTFLCAFSPLLLSFLSFSFACLPSNFDPHWPEVASSHQHCSPLIYITQYSLQLVSPSGRKNSVSALWRFLHLASISVPLLVAASGSALYVEEAQRQVWRCINGWSGSGRPDRGSLKCLQK